MSICVDQKQYIREHPGVSYWKVPGELRMSHQVADLRHRGTTMRSMALGFGGARADGHNAHAACNYRAGKNGHDREGGEIT